MRAHRARATAPTAVASRCSHRAPRSVTRAAEPPRVHPDSALGRALADGVEVTGRLVTELAIAGDGIAVEVVATIGSRLGVALSSLANIFDPELIVIGGGVSAAGELLLEPARERAASASASADERDRGGPGRARARSRVDRRGDDGARGDGLMAGRLTVCPTPIGNVEDLSPRAGRALSEADLVACEDTRRAGRLYERLELPRPRLVSNHEGNEVERARQLVQQIERGARVVLISDAGTPVISDPGYRLIGACISRGLEVEVLPGPSAVTTALVASGLPADRWRFEGFLPRRAGELERVLSSTETLVAFESPRRLPDSLGGLGGAGARSARGRLPGADQAPRGGRTGHARRARAAVSRRRQGRDRGRDRRYAGRARRNPTSASPSMRCGAWFSRAPARGRLREWSPRSPAQGRTISTGAHRARSARVARAAAEMRGR